MGHQHHVSRRKSYDKAVTALKEQASRRKKIAIEYQLSEFDNVVQALQDAGITVTFDKPIVTALKNIDNYGHISLLSYFSHVRLQMYSHILLKG